MSEGSEVYMGYRPYLFVSYSHTDWDAVNKILRILYREGFRIWYDKQSEGIPAGVDWEAVINDRLEHATVFVVFLSNGAVERYQVLRECSNAVKMGKKILPIFLQRVPLDSFPEDVQEAIKHRQYIGLWHYGGITEKFARRLLSAGIWPKDKDVVDDEWRREQGLPPWDPMAAEPEELEDLSSDRGYLYPNAAPVASMGELQGTPFQFYKVSPGETDPSAVYPIALDNQWCPSSFYTDARFRLEGFASKDLKLKRQSLQREEFYRALLHALQVVVNRAYLQNNPIFSAWYSSSAAKEERDAFAALLESGAVVPYLYRESMPCDRPAYETGHLDDWQQFCLEHPMFCLRMDWENTDSNNKETASKLGLCFRNYCLTTAEDPYRMEDLERAFDLPEESVPGFRARWKDIQDAVLQESKQYRAFTRETFYKNFLVRKDAPVVDCVLDPDASFTRELKQVIDLCYNRNLAQAFGLKLMVPDDLQILADVMDNEGPSFRYNELSIEELIYAVNSFSTRFLDTVTWELESPVFTIDQIKRMRDLHGWREYVRALEVGQTRSAMWSVDLSDIALVWERYQMWIENVKAEFTDRPWKSSKGAITIIYRFGRKEWVSIYRSGEDGPVWYKNDGRIGTGKVSISIDYVCGDTHSLSSKNCLKTEIRFFSGMTHETGAYAEEMFRERVVNRKRYHS